MTTETLTRAELVQRADAASGKARYAIWDLIAALDARQAESQAEPRDEVRATLDECWTDPETRFGGNSPVTVRPIALPPDFQLDEQLQLPRGFDHRNKQRAELKEARSKVGSVICPKNNGLNHRFLPYGISPAPHGFPLERCKKCHTTRTMFPAGYVKRGRTAA